MLVKMDAANAGGGGDSGYVDLSTSQETTIPLSFTPKQISIITTGGANTCAYVWSSDKDATKMWGMEGSTVVNGEQVAQYYREANLIITGGNSFGIAKCQATYGTGAYWSAI